MKTYSVSLMCTNYLHLQEDLVQLDPLVDGYHIDIMDGTFVPNFAMNFDMIKSIQQIVTKPLDVHLMVQHPERYLETLSTMKVQGVVVHPETLQDSLPSVIERIRSLGMSIGIALSPGIDETMLLPHLSQIDKITVMMVYPGFAGQSMIASQLDVVERLSSILDEHTTLELDGSTNPSTAEQYVRRGADQFIFGSSLFSDPNLANRFHELKLLFEGKK